MSGIVWIFVVIVSLSVLGLAIYWRFRVNKASVQTFGSTRYIQANSTYEGVPTERKKAFSVRALSSPLNEEVALHSFEPLYADPTPGPENNNLDTYAAATPEADFFAAISSDNASAALNYVPPAALIRDRPAEFTPPVASPDRIPGVVPQFSFGYDDSSA